MTTLYLPRRAGCGTFLFLRVAGGSVSQCSRHALDNLAIQLFEPRQCSIVTDLLQFRYSRLKRTAAANITVYSGGLAVMPWWFFTLPNLSRDALSEQARGLRLRRRKEERDHQLREPSPLWCQECGRYRYLLSFLLCGFSYSRLGSYLYNPEFLASKQ